MEYKSALERLTQFYYSYPCYGLTLDSQCTLESVYMICNGTNIQNENFVAKTRHHGLRIFTLQLEK